MFYVTVDFLRFGFEVDTFEETEANFKKACEAFPFAYVAIRDKKGFTLKEKF